ncbi:CHAD domain-containing protein [Halobacillus rhizosphaerae]|uniref:CHAD domain-containing protein n=1 Tax=Halobacillus rhizosphaerae TaxID=3064889 RepID=UPI00398B45A7
MAEEFIRQVDKMGRLVIPKQVRNTLGFEHVDLSITTLKNGRGITLTKATEKDKDSRTLDSYGRLLVPIELREQLGWEFGKYVEVNIEGSKAILQDQKDQCEICGATESLLAIKQSFLCEDCLLEGLESVTARWVTVMDQLVNEYKEECFAALAFEDIEVTHQARVKGRRLHALFSFVGITEDHSLMKRLKKAHKKLGKVREKDVLIEEFQERAKKTEEKSDAAVYKQLSEKAENKRLDHQKKMEAKLPNIINQEFIDEWNRFREKEFRKYVLFLNIPYRLEEYEKTFDEAIAEYEEIVRDRGIESADALNALHHIRIQAKNLRYIYRYLDEVYNKDYQELADFYTDYQRQFGDIHDLYYWLERLKKDRKNLQVKKKAVKRVKKELKQELADNLQYVNVNKNSE